jgi:hypothetical protein
MGDSCIDSTVKFAAGFGAYGFAYGGASAMWRNPPVPLPLDSTEVQRLAYSREVRAGWIELYRLMLPCSIRCAD